MTDIKERLLPNENIQYQYVYPLWLKLLMGAGLVVILLMLYDDIRAARYLFVVFEVALGFYVVKWLVQVLRDNAHYVVTDRRVMRLDATPASDRAIAYPEISEVRVVRDTLSGSGYVQVEAADQRVIRIPLPNMARAKGEELAGLINQFRPDKPDEQPESE